MLKQVANEFSFVANLKKDLPSFSVRRIGGKSVCELLNMMTTLLSDSVRERNPVPLTDAK